MNILGLSYWKLTDPLTTAYVLPYQGIIARLCRNKGKVYHFCIAPEASNDHALCKPKKSVVKQTAGLIVINLHYKREGIARIFTEALIVVRLFLFIFHRQIRVIHTFCMVPASIGLLLKVCTGVKLVVDSYEPHADAMVESGVWLNTDLKYRVLIRLEKFVALKADTFIAASSEMSTYVFRRFRVRLDALEYKSARINADLFSIKGHAPGLVDQFRLENAFVCVSTARYGGLYMEDEVFYFIFAALAVFGSRFKFLWVTVTNTELIRVKIESFGLEDTVVLVGHVEHGDVARYLNLADFAFNPTRNHKSRRYCTSMKNGEYWACGLPVICGDLVGDEAPQMESLGLGYTYDFSGFSSFLMCLRKAKPFLESISTADRLKIREYSLKSRSFEHVDMLYTRVYGRLGIELP